jgi:UDP-glucose 4-epimerase
MARRILVTGGAGFIGSHLCARLLELGDDVTAFDNLSTGRADHLPEDVELVRGDVADAEAMGALFGSRSFDAVLHVAGQASISKSFAAPERDLQTNVIGTLNVIGRCLERSVPRLLYASSMTVYGEPGTVPTPETESCRPVSYYGVTKHAAELYVHIAGDRPDARLDVTSLRMFNVYGERQSLDNPYQGVLAIFLGSVLRGEPLTIHSDGRQTRDFVHIADVVGAWLQVLDDQATRGRVFNVGSGRETSVNELADAVLQAFGHSREDWPVLNAPEQQGDVRRSLAETSALRRAVAWTPAIGLEDGMARTAAWAREATVRL